MKKAWFIASFVLSLTAPTLLYPFVKDHLDQTNYENRTLASPGPVHAMVSRCHTVSFSRLSSRRDQKIPGRAGSSAWMEEPRHRMFSPSPGGSPPAY